MNLQRQNASTKTAVLRTAVSERVLPLNANIALLLGLEIIPTHSGALLIA